VSVVDVEVGSMVAWQAREGAQRKVGFVVAAFPANRAVSTNGIPIRFRKWRLRFRMAETKNVPSEHYVVACGGLLYHPRPSRLKAVEVPPEDLKGLWATLDRRAHEFGAKHRRKHHAS